MGDYYVRQLRGSAPLINDPLLVQYINSLGMRLVSHAYSVRTPFHFYLINNDDINAFAFFGGNVVLHSALFRYSDTESQLASVMAHEISHVTQRHLARAMEDQKRNAPLTWVGALGSILLAMASPQAGMAALSGTLAGTQQGIISLPVRTKKKPTALVFRYCSGRALIRRPCRPLWKNCSISLATHRARRKCCSLTPCRKAVCQMRATVLTRCVR
ncbi:Putative Zn-dependent protease, contains TPR repeats [Kluyvera cryocrescens]|uniref:Zn-dependent protease, contains TPR repeats n=1 Tax=Kluyvera cryocrescens TaxID=580 RepID=A0A485ATP0_KLUCR|nr:Putative Zn-dependent protease, contains TPR repeats [Kluyvera cryocrescens]